MIRAIGYTKSGMIFDGCDNIEQLKDDDEVLINIKLLKMLFQDGVKN